MLRVMPYRGQEISLFFIYLLQSIVPFPCNVSVITIRVHARHNFLLTTFLSSVLHLGLSLVRFYDLLVALFYLDTSLSSNVST